MAATRRLLEGLRGVESYAVIAYYELQIGISVTQLDPAMTGTCMPQNIGQRLLNDSEAGDCDLAGHLVQVTHDFRGDPRSLLVLRGEPSQRRVQTVGVEHRRAQ